MKPEDASIDGLTSLKALDPVVTDIVNRVIALTHGLSVDLAEGRSGVLAAAGYEAEQRDAAYWFSTASGVFVQLCKVEGQPVLLDPSRIEASVAALDMVDPVLDVLEARLGIVLEPVDLVTCDAVPPVGLRFTVSAEGDDRVGALHEVILAGTIDAFNPQHMAAQSDANPIDPHAMPCIFQIALTLAGLSVDDAAGIDQGDLLLLEKRASARVIWPLSQDKNVAASRVSGWFDFENNCFKCAILGEDRMNDADRQSGFSVPVTISLPAQTTSMATLSALQPGASLPLGTIAEGLMVDISVGGRAIARGELVQIGDRFAVHIETRIDMDDAIDDNSADVG
jgi:hypothetical protein